MSRIVMLCADPGISLGATKGAAVHLSELAAALAREGASVLVLAGGGTPGVHGDAGVTVDVLPGLGKGVPAAIRLAGDAELVAWIEHRASAFGADAIYERLALHTAAGTHAAARLGIPHLVEVNAPLPVEAAMYRFLEEPAAAEALEAEVLGCADVVFAVSSPLAAYVATRGAHVVEVMPNAVALDRFPARSATPRAHATAVLAGRLRPWHGASVVADAWRRIGAGAPRLLVVGDGDGRRELEAVGASVTGLVDHDDVAARLLDADIGLVPYAADAPDYFSPLKLFEYLAAGLAVVAGDLPGVAAIVDEGTGVLVPPGDPVALARAVESLAGDPERRAALGCAGRALVAAAHTWSHRAAHVLETVRRLRVCGAR